jgi:probable HAF family extracellular repeat protein
MFSNPADESCQPSPPSGVGKVPKPRLNLTLSSNRRLFIAIVPTIFSALTLDLAHAAEADRTSTTAAEYKIQDLGELPQLADDVTVSINRDGSVAHWTQTDGAVHAGVWRGGHTAPVGGVPGYPNSIAHAINRRGDIAGWMTTGENPVDSLSAVHGFIRHGERIQMIAGLGGTNSRVLGLSDTGAAVGTADLPGGARHAFLTNGSGMKDLGTLPAGTSSAAYAINRAGQIVGVADVDGRNNHAVTWERNKIADLGTLANGTVSSARAINDRGQIAGFADTPTGFHAFLYAYGVMLDLGTLGRPPSAASGINNQGDVVGSSNGHAFLWHHGRMTNLGTLVPVDSNWILSDAFSINDRGQIACSARRKGEPTHLLLLTPS